MITGYIIERCEDSTDKWLRCNARLCPDLSYRVRNSHHLAFLFEFYLLVCEDINKKRKFILHHDFIC